MKMNDSQVLYKHVKRPSWGLAVVAWEKEGKRGYQFEDGELRIFNSEFFDMLEEVDPPADRTRIVLDRLGRALGRREAARSKNSVLIPLADQIEYFRRQEPDGFAGDSWAEKMRGSDAKTPLKRHRDPAVKRARELLSSELIDELIEERRYDDVIDALIDVLGRTTLITAKKIDPLRSATAQRRESIAVALRRVLHGEGDLAGRFDELVRAIGEPSWELATAPLALLDPAHHVCIKPSVFEQQALWMAPRLDRSKRPRGVIYARYLEMAEAIARQLEEAGLPPGDLLDVHDFVYLTLRPAARKQLAERASAEEAQAA